jgi:hypothetical protein
MRDRVIGVGLGLVLSALTAGAVAWADQPKMREALAHLRQARAALQEAARDKGGHRENAIGLIDQAINQVEQGMEAGR